MEVRFSKITRGRSKSRAESPNADENERAGAKSS
jgi:hypothetical protein